MSRQIRMLKVFTDALHPLYVDVQDESNQHSVPKGSESHFKVIIVSDQFDALSRVSRHRKVNHLVNDEFEQGLHALSLFLYTAKEWEEKETPVAASPVCKGGSLHDQGERN